MSDQLVEKMNSNKIHFYTQREYEEIKEKIGITIIDNEFDTVEFEFILSDGKHLGVTSIDNI